MKHKTDKELIELIKKKDEKTILFLRNEYTPMIKYMIINYKLSDGDYAASATMSDVDDLLHDALYILINKIINENLVLTSKLSTYFYAVSKNLLKVKLNKNLREKRQKKYLIDYSYKPEETDVLYDKNLHQKTFDYYYMQMSDVCQKILNLYWLEYSVKEISEKLNLTKNYIMKRKYECIIRLTRLIKDNADHI